VFDPSKGDVALQIHDATGGKGVDVAIETAGAYEALHTALRATRICGTVCAAGFYQGEARAIHLGREFHHNRLNLVAPHGCGWGHEPRDYPRWNKKRTTDSIISMMRQGKLKCPGLIYPIVPLGKGPEVWDHILNDPDKVIKYAIKFC
jgi:threonine dehydrogenase-like Zn-dependent dehydrogenase